MCHVVFLFTGMIEMVTDAETLRKIQVELGLTGSFKDRSIAEWLAKYNPSTLEYERAVENFTGIHWHLLTYLLAYFLTSLVTYLLPSLLTSLRSYFLTFLLL
jgi:hypothetical protein